MYLVTTYNEKVYIYIYITQSLFHIPKTLKINYTSIKKKSLKTKIIEKKSYRVFFPKIGFREEK